MAGEAFELARVLQQPREVRIGRRRRQLGNHLHRLVERHVQLRRHELRQPIDLAQRNIERAADIADHRARLHRAEGDDLGDVILAVSAADVVDDPVAIAIVEVDVDIRHRDALAIEEPLEEQPVVKRVELGNAQRV